MDLEQVHSERRSASASNQAVMTARQLLSILRLSQVLLINNVY